MALAGGSLVLDVGAVHMLEGKLTVGTLLMIMSYLGFVHERLSMIATTAGSLHNALTSARRMREVLRLPGEADLHAGGAHVRLHGDVRFDAVSFCTGTITA